MDLALLKDHTRTDCHPAVLPPSCGGKLQAVNSSPVLPGPKQEKEKENLRHSSKCPEMKHTFIVGFVVQNSTLIHTLMFSASGLQSCLKPLA